MTRPVGPAAGEVRRGAVLYAVASRSDAVRLAPVIAALSANGVAQTVARPWPGTATRRSSSTPPGCR